MALIDGITLNTWKNKLLHKVEKRQVSSYFEKLSRRYVVFQRGG